MKKFFKRPEYVVIYIFIFCSIVLALTWYITSRPNKELALQIYGEYEDILSKKEDISDFKDLNFSANFLNSIGKKSKAGNVIATIEIPKIKLSYPVLKETTTEFLKIAPTKLFGPQPNRIGNFCIVGHNNFNGTMFSNLHKLDIGDNIILTSYSGLSKTYKVVDKYEVHETDTSCTSQKTSGKTILTLITCVKEQTKRLVIRCEATN